MEYVKFGELFDYIVEKGRLQEDEARHFFQQVDNASFYIFCRFLFSLLDHALKELICTKRGKFFFVLFLSLWIHFHFRSTF